MDPISQGALGAVAAQNLAHRKHLAVACVLGLLAGMSADLDIFIHSDTDPLLFLKYHRQFTHSLVFIPVGGLICASILWLFVHKRWQVSFRQALLYCTAGYATHALLDSCTSYGTQLFWPFSDYRVSWSNMSIIDPLFTLPTVVLIVLAAVKKKSVYIRIAAVWILAYLAFGFVQKERTRSTGWEVAQSRGHAPVRLEAKPGFGNLLLWKVIYETEDKIYVVGVRAGIRKRVYPGQSVDKLDMERDFPWLAPDSRQARDVERFRWFSDDFVAVDPNHSNRIIDARYSMLPDEIEGLWIIELSPDKTPEEHVNYLHEHSPGNGNNAKLWSMILDRIE